LKRIENDGIEEGEVTSFLVYFLFLHFFVLHRCSRNIWIGV